MNKLQIVVDDVFVEYTDYLIEKFKSSKPGTNSKQIFFEWKEMNKSTAATTALQVKEKPKTAYQTFSSIYKEKMKLEGRHVTSTSLSKEISQKWKSLRPDEKKKYAPIKEKKSTAKKTPVSSIIEKKTKKHKTNSTTKTGIKIKKDSVESFFLIEDDNDQHSLLHSSRNLQNEYNEDEIEEDNEDDIDITEELENEQEEQEEVPISLVEDDDDEDKEDDNDEDHVENDDEDDEDFNEDDDSLTFDFN